MTRKVVYMLRRVLCPWNAEDIVSETMEWASARRIDEIMWITESSGMYQELLPLPEIRKIVERLKMAKKRTEAAGIAFSINPLTTIGHGDYGKKVAKVHPGLEMMVDFQGATSQSCACPLSPVWRTLMKETYALYASTNPVRLWVEDDFNYFNHGPRVRFGCYCKRHLEQFGRRIGRPVTREELVRAILQPGDPHPWRATWNDFLIETLLEVAAMLRETVAAVSPETEMGWMSSNPGRHEMEGPRVRRQMEIFAGGKSAAIRMRTTGYKERGPTDLLIEDEGLKKMVPQLPLRTTRCTEIETIPHATWNASAARMAAQIEWACILNVTNQTLNIFDYLGTPLAESPTYDDMLRSRKDEFSAFAKAFADLTTWRGIGIPGDPISGRHVRTTEGKDMIELMAREGGWVDPLRAFGMPIHQSKDEKVTAVTGHGLGGMNEKELEALFSRGVLLDVSALAELQNKGRADLAGVRLSGLSDPSKGRLGPEELTDVAFGGGNSVGILDTSGGRPISRILDADGDFFAHGFVIFENAFGGRVATAPYFFQGAGPDPYEKGPPPHFYTPWRRRQFHALMRWLSHDRVPLIVHQLGWILPHRADRPSGIGLAAMNLNLDSWNGVQMTCVVQRPVREIEWLDINGVRRDLAVSAWRQEGEEVTLTISADVPPLRTVAALLEL